MKLVEIDWIDSIHDSGWKNLSEWKPGEEQMYHKTVGYVVSDTKTSLGVCQSYGLNREDPSLDSIMQIPHVAILKVTVLRKAATRKK